ncbi:MAG TPA: hypothetical protein VEW48_18010 [Thermoanaerobaculia bacterium]|nr:hypothetical protein [Thermoanaerobaculia bacterium]
MKTGRVTFLLTFILTLCLAASEVLAQDPKGTEIRVNQRTAGSQAFPDVAAAADGRFVVVWKDGRLVQGSTQPVSVVARIFDAAGKPLSGEIQVARIAPGALGSPAVAMAPDGRFVVVWGGGKEDPNIVFGRRFAADGRPLGPRFLLAGSTERAEDSPDVALAPDGSFVAVWTQETEGDAEVNTDIFFRRFGADGKPLGPEAVALGGYEEQSGPRVALKPNGDFVVAGQSYGGESSFYDIVAGLFSRSGAPLDSFQVNDGPSQEVSQFGPSVAVAADGRFAIAWTDRGADFTKDPHLGHTQDFTGIAARFYSADGVALGPGLSTNAFLPGEQLGAEVSALQTGGFLVLWMSGAGQDGDEFGIFARVYGANGKARGREFRINLNRKGSQAAPAISVAPNGKGAAVWYGPDGDGTGIFARLIGAPGQGS